jgi:hypothetical protein
MTRRVEKKYGSQDLFVVEPQEDRPAFAKRVTCRLCGTVVFDSIRDAQESFGVFVHGMKAHYAIQHDITMGDAPCGETDRS